MIPLTITARLAGPLAYHPAEGLSLDGSLLYAAVAERLGHAAFGDVPGNDVLAAETAQPDPRVPLGVAWAGADWIYRCSLGVITGHVGTERLHWHKRFDDALAQRAIEAGALALGRKAKVPVNSGEFKGYRMPLYLEHVEAVTWYAVGDGTEVMRLLTTHVHHLGKRRNAGMGAVATWDVAPWEGRADRWCWADDARTVPARHLPLTMLPAMGAGATIDPDDAETVLAGVRPPYWLAAHQTLCLALRPEDDS